MDIESKVMELMGLCYEVNSTTDHDVFFSFYGHIDGIDVYIYESGFNKGSGERIDITHAFLGFDDALDVINEAIEKLEEYL